MAKKKIYFIFSVGLLILMGVSLFFGIGKRISLKKNNQAKKTLLETEEKFNQEKLISSQQEMDLTDIPVFMDLNLIQDGALGVSLASSGKNLAILDSSKQKAYLLDYEKKSHKIYDFSVEEADFLIPAGGNLIVFSKGGIEKIDPENKKTATVIAKDEDWEDIVGLSAFSRNLYLLDKGSETIWRYLIKDGGEYSNKSEWFVEKPPDLSNAVSLAIDSSIWVLEKDGILKFSLGKQEDFSLSKFKEGFENPAKIYTSENEENLYVLDKGRGKIYQIAKDGEFKTAYSWEGLKQADDLVAIESAKKIFVLSGSKIYEIPLR